MNAKEYINYLLSVEEYSFSLEEIAQNTNGVGTSLKFELIRLVEKGQIFNLRKGFYLIIPPRYSSVEKLPIQLYAEKLFKYLNRKYYLGLHTAAKLYGASHQQSQKDYLITETPKLNAIKKKDYDIQFFTTKDWPVNNILNKKSDAGIYKVSSPALTFVDLIHHHRKIGGLNRILASLEELSEEIHENEVLELTSWYNHKSTLQRAGFIMDELSVEKVLTDIIYDKLKQQAYYPVLLSPMKDQNPGSSNNRWKIVVNKKLESDI
jgi:predicted transcriptional regulator of viral defense system